jgi:peptide chain release factor 1
MEHDELQREYEELSARLSSGELLGKRDELAQASRRLKELADELERIKAAERRAARRREAEKILATESDPELRHLAEEELKAIDEEEAKFSEGSTMPEEKETAILEIRPGTGGEEAALFAADLARMYLRFAERRHWEVTIVDESVSDLGGIKSLTCSITGPRAYTILSREAGVHRVQRIPQTEKAGRIHTSTATVAVLQPIEPRDLIIPPEELRIDTMRASGPGGQFVNRRESAVRILHIPTGIIVTSQTLRTQAANREQALKILRAKLAEKKRLEEETAVGTARKAQIGSGDRSEKIRTYNFPQDRVTDHRIGKTWHNLKAILDGDLDSIVEALEHLAQ